MGNWSIVGRVLCRGQLPQLPDAGGQACAQRIARPGVRTLRPMHAVARWYRQVGEGRSGRGDPPRMDVGTWNGSGYAAGGSRHFDGDEATSSRQDLA